MFSALYALSFDNPALDMAETLAELAREFSPRVERQGRRIVMLDASGLRCLFGPPHEVGAALGCRAADRGLTINVGMAETRTTALLMAIGRRGVSVVAAGSEASTLAPLPLEVLSTLAEEQRLAPSVISQSSRGSLAPSAIFQGSRGPTPARAAPRLADSLVAAAAGARLAPSEALLSTIRRWGLRTLGELAALPSADLFERTGAAGLELQRLARGIDRRPLRPEPVDEPFEASMSLEWPIETLEPLAFVVDRLLEPLCVRLDVKGLSAAVLHLRLRLVSREPFIRTLELPMPLRDARVLRTLIMLDLESQALPAPIDRVTVVIEPVPARAWQFSLLERPHPSAEQMSTVLGRLTALMGARRCGAPALVDSDRPGAFDMRPFTEALVAAAAGARLAPSLVLRRFRPPVPARVTLEDGRPVRVATGVEMSGSGRVVMRAGPWRSSGEWWKTGAREKHAVECHSLTPSGITQSSRGPTPARAAPRLADSLVAAAAGASLAPGSPWDRDEWDVALSDGGVYRIFCDRLTGRWFVEGVVD